MKAMPEEPSCAHPFCHGRECSWPERRAVLIGEHLARHARARQEVTLDRVKAEAGGQQG